MELSELNALLEQNKWEEAITYLNNFPKPLNEQLSEKLCWCYSRVGKYNDAINLCEELIDSQPQKAKWHYMKGYQLYMLKCWEEAINNFKNALELYPEYFVVKYRLSYALIQLSGTYMQWTKDVYWQAIQQLEECHIIYSQYSDEDKAKNKSIYADVCGLHGKTIALSPKHISRSIELLQKAIDIKDNYDHKYQLAKAYYLNKEYDNALKVLPKKNKDDYYVLELKADILVGSGNIEEANKILFILIKFRNKDYLYRKISENFLLINQLEQASEYALRAVKMGKNNHLNYFVYGKISYLQDQKKTAVAYLRKASELKRKNYNTDYIEANQLIGLIFDKTDNNPTDNKLNIITSEPMVTKLIGKIVQYNSKKGFGFIESKELESNVFFHITKCNNICEPSVGMLVSFEIETTNKGVSAKNVVEVE